MKSTTNSLNATQKINFGYLEKLNTILDCPCGCRASMEAELLNLKSQSIPQQLLMRYNYMVGKLYFYKSKVNEELKNLELANEYFDKIWLIASQIKCDVTSTKMYFKRAHTKMILAERIPRDADSKQLLDKSNDIVLKGLKRHPKNLGLLWLKGELTLRAKLASQVLCE